MTDFEAAKAKAEKTVVKGSCACGPECWEKLLCACCRQNKGACCRKKTQDATATLCRTVGCWTVWTTNRELVGKVGEVADFLEETMVVFDAETSSYFRTMKSGYDGILVHSDMSSRGRRDWYGGGKHHLNLYAPEFHRDRSWCVFFCDGFLSRCQKEPLPDKDRETMLLYVAARVIAKLKLEGGDRRLERYASDQYGMGRILHELCLVNDMAIGRYYAAKVKLFETGRFNSLLSASDMAEVFSWAIGRDAFQIFRKYGISVQKDKVATRLRGFAEADSL